MTVRHTFTCAKCQSLRLILHTNGEMNSYTGRFRCLPKYHGFDASPHDSLRWFPAAAPSHEQAPQQCPTVISFAETRAFRQRNTCYKHKVKWYGDIIFYTQSWKTYGSKWSSEEIDTNKWNVISTLSTQQWLFLCAHWCPHWIDRNPGEVWLAFVRHLPSFVKGLWQGNPRTKGRLSWGNHL